MIQPLGYKAIKLETDLRSKLDSLQFTLTTINFPSILLLQ